MPLATGNNDSIRLTIGTTSFRKSRVTRYLLHQAICPSPRVIQHPEVYRAEVVCLSATWPIFVGRAPYISGGQGRRDVGHGGRCSHGARGKRHSDPHVYGILRDSSKYTSQQRDRAGGDIQEDKSLILQRSIPEARRHRAPGRWCGRADKVAVPLSNSILNTLVVALLFIAVFAPMLLAVGLNTSDQQFLRAFWTAVRQKIRPGG
jgi:hypothetical protein